MKISCNTFPFTTITTEYIPEIRLTATLKSTNQEILKLSDTDGVLKEMLNDLLETNQAIIYWQKKSPERAKQYQDLSRDLEKDIHDYWKSM